MSVLSETRARISRPGPLFLAVVFVPTLLAVIYFGFIASSLFVSEARFVVRSPDKPAQTPLGTLLKGAGFSNAGDETFAVRDYVVSRDALAKVNRDGLVRRAFTHPSASVFDRFNPFGWSGSNEQLFRYYEKKVGIEYDASSSILHLSVRAFDPRDARVINLRLLDASERLVNQLNQRGQKDQIAFAKNEVAEARQRAQAAGQALAAFRNREGVVDPEKQAAAQLQLVGKLQDELVATRVQLRQLLAFTPDNPQIPVLRVKVRGLRQEIDQALSGVAGSRRSLAAAGAQYQRLLLDSQIADRQLGVAMSAQADAVSDARRKQAYVERIVEPIAADYPVEPRRLRGILSVLALSIIVWLVARMLIAGVKEHQD